MSSSASATTSTSSSASAISSVHPRISELQNEISTLRSQLGDHDPDAIIQNHIKLLHTYNEIKDGTQSLIGVYARLTKKSLAEFHEELGLPTVEL